MYANGSASDVCTNPATPVINVSNIATGTIGKTSIFTTTATTENSPMWYRSIGVTSICVAIVAVKNSLSLNFVGMKLKYVCSRGDTTISPTVAINES